MTEVLRPMEHLRECSYRFDLESGAGTASVESVVVRVD